MDGRDSIFTEKLKKSIITNSFDFIDTQFLYVLDNFVNPSS